MWIIKKTGRNGEKGTFQMIVWRCWRIWLVTVGENLGTRAGRHRNEGKLSAPYTSSTLAPVLYGFLLDAGATEYELVISLPMEAESLVHQNFREDGEPSYTVFSSNLVFSIRSTNHVWVWDHSHSSLLSTAKGPSNDKSKLWLLQFPSSLSSPPL